MNGGGPGSGIWKSIDGGDTWTRLTGSGLPAGSLGRIGLDVYRKNGNIVYASIEGRRRTRRAARARAARRGGGRPRRVVARRSDVAVVAAAARGGGRRRDRPLSLGRRRRDVAARSAATNPRPMYFSQVRVDPNNPDRVYQGGVKMPMTVDGGKTMERSGDRSSRTTTCTRSGSIRTTPITCSSAATAASTRRTTARRRGVLRTTCRSACSITSATTWRRRSTSAAACRTTTTGAGRARRGSRTGIINHDWFQIAGRRRLRRDSRPARLAHRSTASRRTATCTRRNKVTGESKSIRPTRRT